MKEYTIGFTRTINLGNYESAKIEASASFTSDTPMEYAQDSLRKLLEATWKAQKKPSDQLE
jgi:hypothetical protein